MGEASPQKPCHQGPKKCSAHGASCPCSFSSDPRPRAPPVEVSYRQGGNPRLTRKPADSIGLWKDGSNRRRREVTETVDGPVVNGRAVTGSDVSARHATACHEKSRTGGTQVWSHKPL